MIAIFPYGPVDPRGKFSGDIWMMTNLWSANHPRDFWQCQPMPTEDAWQDAITRALPSLELAVAQPDIDTVLAMTLGEGRYGPDHWKLGFAKRGYYLVKSFLPRPIILQLRRFYNREIKTQGFWPIEHRYVYFLWGVLRQIMLQGGYEEVLIKNFWPDRCRFAFVLTHDVETAAGQEFVKVVADLEESLGFHSSFNFVPERYKLNYGLMDAVRQRGFEIGVHGLRHNGRLFDSKPGFIEKASRINKYLKEWDACGFRAELTLRNPTWMQVLDVEYDLSFFDVDPCEPIPGGTMSIWPFFVGRFVELPYTLVQDYTLTSVLAETTPRIWLEKIAFIEKYHGMALVNSHPDYLIQKTNWDVYQEFLITMNNCHGLWHALPRDVARWWQERTSHSTDGNMATAFLRDGKLVLDVLPQVQGSRNS
jgi:peptidoglycan/xylan/chitin deacetylase (PgdA/CDA1 family)